MKIKVSKKIKKFSSTKCDVDIKNILFKQIFFYKLKCFILY